MLPLYYKSSNSPTPMLYATSSVWFNDIDEGSIQNLTLTSTPDDNGYAYSLDLDYRLSDSPYPTGGRILVRPKYNTTSTFLRLDIDGNIRLYTYFDKVDNQGWEVTYTLFNRDFGDESRVPVAGAVREVWTM